MKNPSPQLIAGAEILEDAGYLREDRIRILLAAEKTGLNVEDMARKLVRLCDAVADERGQ